MTWRHFKTAFQHGLALTPTLQNAWYTAYLQHIAGGGNLLRECAVFVRSNAAANEYEFYFTPQAVKLMSFWLDAIGAQACEQPTRFRPDDGRWDGLTLCCGEAAAWDYFKGEEKPK